MHALPQSTFMWVTSNNRLLSWVPGRTSAETEQQTMVQLQQLPPLVAHAAFALLLAAMLATSTVVAGTPLHLNNQRAVFTGADQLQLEDYRDLKANTGIVTNPTAVFAPSLSHLVDQIHEHSTAGPKLTAVFGPEHGFRGDKQAGEGGKRTTDPRTGLPVYDLYLKRGPAMDEIIRGSGVQHLVLDIQDIGTRFYTYVWTLWDVLESCARLRIPLTVLDRPNPLGGTVVAGPVLRKGYTSGVGWLPIPMQHGMTMGELAILFNEYFIGNATLMRELGLQPHDRKAQLTVVPMRGWDRKMLWPETGLPWVGPSPNIPNFEAAAVYPGFGLLEGTNCSEGRGTTRPFEIVGAPFLNQVREPLAVAMNKLNLPGVQWREVFFTPTFSKFTGEVARGTQAYITDLRTFDPIDACLNWMIQVKRIAGSGKFGWRRDNWIDLLSGNPIIRQGIDAGLSSAEIVKQWQPELEQFKLIRSKFLLYA